MIQRLELNVLGTALESCCQDPMTGYFRDGLCRTDEEDHGSHTVCATMTAEFLAFSRSRGNDLMTPRPEFSFPGLAPGDCWCLCAMRWQEAFEAGCPPPVRLESCHARALDHVSLADLEAHRLEPS